MASAEIQREERRQVLRQLKERFVNKIASDLLNYPSVRRQGHDYFPDAAEGEADPTADQLQAVRTGAGGWTLDLIAAATDQNGFAGGKAAVELLSRFFIASGMIYRLRCEEIERRHRESNAKGRPDYSRIPAVWPKWPKFWSTPKIHYQSRLEGTNCLEGVDREGLKDVATEFYRTGIRCQFFEKCLIEALLHAELYATVKLARQGGLSTTVVETFLRSWSFSKTLGNEPGYGIYIGIGYLLKAIMSLTVFGALTAWAVISYAGEATWKNVSALVVLALIGTSVVGRWLVRLVVTWSQPDAKVTAALLVEKHPVFRAINELERLAKIVTEPDMSTSIARAAALRCHSNGGGFDQVIMPYLDRAIAAGEFLWTTRYRPFTFDEIVDDADFETKA